MADRLRASSEDSTGMQNYTAIGQADADLTSATMALESLLRRPDLTPAQRRDFTAALRRAREAARSVARHIDYGDEDKQMGLADAPKDC